MTVDGGSALNRNPWQGNERLPLPPAQVPSLPLTKEISRHGTTQLSAWIHALHLASARIFQGSLNGR